MSARAIAPSKASRASRCRQGTADATASAAPSSGSVAMNRKYQCDRIVAASATPPSATHRPPRASVMADSIAPAAKGRNIIPNRTWVWPPTRTVKNGATM